MLPKEKTARSVSKGVLASDAICVQNGEVMTTDPRNAIMNRFAAAFVLIGVVGCSPTSNMNETWHTEPTVRSTSIGNVERIAGPFKFTKEVCDKIKKGMTREDVEAILGRPSGDYTTRPWTRSHGREKIATSGPIASIDEWVDDYGSITVVFRQILDSEKEPVVYSVYFDSIEPK